MHNKINQSMNQYEFINKPMTLLINQSINEPINESNITF